jgi:hypothetical protein
MPARRLVLAQLLLLLSYSVAPPMVRAGSDGLSPEPAPYSAIGPGQRPSGVFSVAPPLVSAWERLIALPEIGERFRESAPRTGVRVIVGILPTGMGGHFRATDRTILVNASLLREDERLVVPILAHELTHAIDVLLAPGEPADCLDLETRAFVQQARAWESLSGQLQVVSPRQAELDDLLRTYRSEGSEGILRRVASHPGYRQQCAALNLAGR